MSAKSQRTQSHGCSSKCLQTISYIDDESNSIQDIVSLLTNTFGDKGIRPIIRLGVQSVSQGAHIPFQSANSDNSNESKNNVDTSTKNKTKGQQLQEMKDSLDAFTTASGGSINNCNNVNVNNSVLAVSSLADSIYKNFSHQDVDKLIQQLKYKLQLSPTVVSNTMNNNTVPDIRDIVNVSSIAPSIQTDDPLVVAMGIGKYNGLQDLDGVSIDYDNFINTFVNNWKYKVFYRLNNDCDIYTNDKNKLNRNYKLKWSDEEIEDFIIQARKHIVKNRHNGLLFAISSHGDIEKVMYDSNGDKVQLDGIFCMFSPQASQIITSYQETAYETNHLFVIPKIFFLDMCRGDVKAKVTNIAALSNETNTNPSNPINPINRINAAKAAKTAEMRKKVKANDNSDTKNKMTDLSLHEANEIQKLAISKQAPDTEVFTFKSVGKEDSHKLVAQMANFCKVYANIDGYSVADGSLTGGVFLKNVCRIFSDKKFVLRHQWSGIIFKLREYTKRDATLIGKLFNFTQLVENEGTLERRIEFGSKYVDLTKVIQDIEEEEINTILQGINEEERKQLIVTDAQQKQTQLQPKKLTVKATEHKDDINKPSASKDNTTRTIGRWYIGETLGKGGYSWVKKGIDIKNGKHVALKFIDRKTMNNNFSIKRVEQIKTEITVLKRMRHSNIVRLFAYNMKTKYPERDESKPGRNVMFLVLEYMSGGELFDLLYYTNALSEILARTYFRQLMAGVEALHRHYMTHRDLKPQNLLLDKHYNLKISDFGLSKILESADESRTMDTYNVGTRGYQSPEILLHKPYTFGCDIFSCGVILFLLLTGYPPFQTATVDDRWYGNIAHGKAKKFWKQHRGSGLTPYAIDLITKMLAFDPNSRISIDNIKKHPWYNDEIIENTQDLQRLIQLRHKQMEVKRANDPIKQQILVASEKFRGSEDKDSLDAKEDELDKSMIPKPLSQQDGVGIFDVFTTHSAYSVLSFIQEFSTNQLNSTPTIDKNECSVVLHTALESPFDEAMCEALIRVYKYDEYECNLVRFVRLRGDPLSWRRTFEQLMIWLRPVLNGVPQNIEQEQFVIDNKDEQLLKKYFTPPRDAAMEKRLQQKDAANPIENLVGVT